MPIELIILIALNFVVLIAIWVFLRSSVKKEVEIATTSVLKSETKMMEVTSAMTAEIQLLPLLQKVMETVTEILDADRSTLFLYDAKTDELWSQVAEGLKVKEIRFPSNVGIAGSVFSSGNTINIQDAYQDDRFNKAVDKKTGYRTQSILCMQLRNKANKPIGVVQVLNKAEGPFTDMDEKRLRAFSANAAIAIENSQLFDTVSKMKNYNESMLESMRHGIITTDEDMVVVKANSAARTLLQFDENFVGMKITDFFTGKNQWVSESVRQVTKSHTSDEALDALLQVGRKKWVSINLSVQPLHNEQNEDLGCMMIFEDITMNKRLRSTMARFLTKELTDRLLEDGEHSLGGTLQTATILFSDIRRFTDFAERNGPQETVSMLNQYFTVMYEQIIKNKGILDKYIGDAIMSVFGVPFPNSRDADNAVQTSIDMMKALDVFNKNRIREGLEPIKIGIGVNTGEVVSGNIGSDKRMDYTVIGDGVNLAARLEGITKLYKASILISESTKRALQGRYLLRELDLIRVKGKEEPVAIYEVVDAYEYDKIRAIRENLEQFQKALQHYRTQQWEGASEIFLQQVYNVQDPVSALFLERCRYFQANPPGDDWDGVWVMKTK